MRRLLHITVTVAAMLLVALLAGAVSLRLAIHGREAAVPNLTGLADKDAAIAAHRLGLNLSVENRFYSSAVAPNHVLSQAPPAGEIVRRGWQVRVSESLGGQRVTAPDMVGEAERPAMLMLSRLQLDVAPQAYLPWAGAQGIVVSQSPPPSAADATSTRVALLVSGPEVDPDGFAYIMPRIVGMTVQSASGFLASAGLRLGSTPEARSNSSEQLHAGTIGLAQPDTMADSTGSSTPAGQSEAAPARTPVAPPRPIDPAAVITTQYPAPGHRVTRADVIRVTSASGARPVWPVPQF